MIEAMRLMRGGIHRVRRAPSYCRSALEHASIVAENLFTRTNERLIVIDDLFPSLATTFRVAEINAILNHFKTAVVYSKCPDRQVFARYAACYPQFCDRVRKFHPLRRLEGSAAYIIFLNNIFASVQFLEKARLPFVFELYPGGGFYLNDAATDGHLERVVSSPMFRKVIVTQNVTRDYLLRKKFCRREEIEFIYGVVEASDALGEISDRRLRCGTDKRCLDICFVANKYVPRGVDKGYDRFIGCARILRGRHREVRFHVVGDFSEEDVEVTDLRDCITFYGHQFTPFFPGFYSRMDAILSPNVPFLFAPGAFDGFPTGCCIEAALCGVAMFVSDELAMNEGRLKNGEEVVIIPRGPEQIAELVEKYVADPERLARLAENGQRAVRDLFAIDVQMMPRLRLLSDLLAGASADDSNGL
jgi:glycosyltransferase involved in cell wall biosynthesis